MLNDLNEVPLNTVSVINRKTGKVIGDLIGAEKVNEAEGLSLLVAAEPEAPNGPIRLPWVCVEKICSTFILVYY